MTTDVPDTLCWGLGVNVGVGVLTISPANITKNRPRRRYDKWGAKSPAE